MVPRGYKKDLKRFDFHFLCRVPRGLHPPTPSLPLWEAGVECGPNPYPRGARPQGNKIRTENQTLFSDTAMGAFRCDG